MSNERNVDILFERTDKLMSMCLAQSCMLQVLFGHIATNTRDWRDTIDHNQMLAEFTIQNHEWTGSAEQRARILSAALTHMRDLFEELRHAIVRAEQDEPPAQAMDED